MFNDVIAAQEASIADPANRPIEIPKGRPQIEWLKDLQQWSARGHVLKCEVSDDEDGNLVVKAYPFPSGEHDMWCRSHRRT